jgi:hypothetical protein
MAMRNLALLACSVLMVVGCSSGSDKAAAGAGGNRDGGATRLSIKHANDPDAKLINSTAKDLSVEDLLSMKVPEGTQELDKYGSSRIGDFEKSTYRISGTLKSIVHRKDGDYYLVMEGKSGAQAVIEVPDPKQCEGSPILPQITAARNELESKYHPTEEKKDINQPATIEGVGFFGWKGKQGSGGRGSAPRLMPGTGFHEGGAH